MTLAQRVAQTNEFALVAIVESKEFALVAIAIVAINQVASTFAAMGA
jgi:hypothetical protein